MIGRVAPYMYRVVQATQDTDGENKKPEPRSAVGDYIAYSACAAVGLGILYCLTRIWKYGDARKAPPLDTQQSDAPVKSVIQPNHIIAIVSIVPYDSGSGNSSPKMSVVYVSPKNSDKSVYEFQ